MLIETDRLIITEFRMEMAPTVQENSLDEDNRRFVPNEVWETVEEAEGVWEVGYHIAKKHTGHGYATEAVKAFLPVIAKEVGIKEIYGICLSDNAASHVVMERCGFINVFKGIAPYQGVDREVIKNVWRV